MMDLVDPGTVGAVLGIGVAYTHHRFIVSVRKKKQAEKKPKKSIDEHMEPIAKVDENEAINCTAYFTRETQANLVDGEVIELADMSVCENEQCKNCLPTRKAAVVKAKQEQAKRNQELMELKQKELAAEKKRIEDIYYAKMMSEVPEELNEDTNIGWTKVLDPDNGEHLGDYRIVKGEVEIRNPLPKRYCTKCNMLGQWEPWSATPNGKTFTMCPDCIQKAKELAAEKARVKAEQKRQAEARAERERYYKSLFEPEPKPSDEVVMGDDLGRIEIDDNLDTVTIFADNKPSRLYNSRSMEDYEMYDDYVHRRKRYEDFRREWGYR